MRGSVRQALLALGGCWAVVAFAAPTPASLALVCEAVYSPARDIWVRTVDIGYNDQRISGLSIDGVPVHSFWVEGTVILTALDNERIQIDVGAQTWRSDFRGQASSQGRCARAR